jgi:uncharacterized protein (DUF608 family)
MVREGRPWPVLRHYDESHLRRVALPLGGLGTGTFSLGGRGDLRDWEIGNRPAKGFTPAHAFFAIRTQYGDLVTTRLLEGPVDPADYEGAQGSPVPGAGLPRFRHAAFDAAYPLGRVALVDPDVPLRVRLEAFNPFVPADARSSGIPAAVLRYVLRNPTDKPVVATVCGSMPNLVGAVDSPQPLAGGRNEFRDGQRLIGVTCAHPAIDAADARHGTMALAVIPEPDDVVTRRTAWLDATWGTSLLEFWDDLAADGRLEQPPAPDAQATASVAVSRTVPPGAQAEVTFVLAWHFPNRTAWNEDPTPDNTVGNYYATQWPDAWAAAAELASRLDELESRTVDFVTAVSGSDIPRPIIEAALSSMSTLRTQTCFRAADGRFYGWEGCNDRSGSCHGSCTHVWNYEPATAHLFGELARSMREVEFAHGVDESGLMSFRIGLPLDREPGQWRLAAADGQMGCLIKLWREWRLSGDDDLLRSLWPAARRALEFCWIPGGWDADQDGVMEGCQHNTMDVEYFGPNPEVGCWYLGALRAGAEMAAHAGEADFAAECADLFARGSAWMDANLFNGRWYAQQIRPPRDAGSIAPGLRHDDMGARDVANPDLQIGPGCLTDQLAGATMAEMSGLGPLLDRSHTEQTLRSILAHNRVDGVSAHFNPMRAYVLGEESGLLVCSYPDGDRPDNPFPYSQEVWTGLEYTAAAGLAQHGRFDDAAEVVADVRDRFDGQRRNPFDEAECGHHYARAMAAWGVLLAWTGFGYDAHRGRLRLRGRDRARWFFSTGNAWGTAIQRHHGGALEVTVDVREGAVRLTSVELAGLGECVLAESVVVAAGESVTLHGQAMDPG